MLAPSNSIAKRISVLLTALILCQSNSLQANSFGRPGENVSRFVLGDSAFSVTVAPGEFEVTREEINTYVRDAARAVIAYYGSFPVSQTIVRVAPTDSDGVGFATSTHDDDAGHGLIEIDIGSGAIRDDLERSWTMTHEMMHLAFPIMGHKHRWLAEGIATYIEPIGRMRIGKLSREEVWGDLARNLYKGLPGTGGSGLNSATGFGRIYWGGALYCLLADIEIRKRTKNRMGLEHALRAIANQGGTAASDWSAAQALKAGDEAVGLTVLEDLYEQMALRPATLDVNSLMKELGVRSNGPHTYLDERAPLAYIRRAIEGKRL